jgi:hypothetical protein
MTAVPQYIKTEQAGTGLAAIANPPAGRIWYVDSTNGNNGNPGWSAIYPLATLTQALTKAEAGDTIVLAPGGSETVTATLSVAVANLKIICPVANPKAGYTITGAGTLALMTVTAAGVHVEGLAFAHTGTTASAQGILTTNAADRLVVKNCLFDDSAISATWTGAGVEVVNACDDVIVDGCLFLDCQFGVKFTMATGVVCSRPAVKGCTFFVGQSAAFGIASALTGTGAVKGLTVTGLQVPRGDRHGRARDVRLGRLRRDERDAGADQVRGRGRSVPHHREQRLHGAVGGEGVPRPQRDRLGRARLGRPERRREGDRLDLLGQEDAHLVGDHPGWRGRDARVGRR